MRKKARPVQDFQGLKKLAEDMLESEREMNTATPPRLVPKGPEGGGFVVQISGHTMHEGKLVFLKRALVRNFARSAAFAEASSSMPCG